MAKYRVKHSDLGNRWKAGEVGVAVDQGEHFKYDVWLDFGDQKMPEGTELFGRPIKSIRRVFGFMLDEVEPV